jgi:transcriptional regulator with GAF, ATPase, and Fis domain
MFEIPSRDSLDGLKAAAHAIAATPLVGVARVVDDNRVSVVYVYPHGVGEFVLPAAEVLDAFQPINERVEHVDEQTLRSRLPRAVETFLLDNEIRRVLSVRLPDVDAPIRVWFAFPDAERLTADRLERLEALAREHAAAIARPLAAQDHLRRLERLEQAAELIPALLHVLDVREVIDRLSTAAKPALSHDLLLLYLFSDDLATFTVYARSDQGAGLGVVQPNAYPPSTIQAWRFSIVDDHTMHPMEQHSPATQIGARSSLRFPVRFDDRVIGGVAFVSFRAHAFTDADVPIGKRLADHVASAISHFILAERLADQAKRTEELRAQTTNLELLDELLDAFMDSGELPDVFERISEIAGKVLRHDALALLVRLADGRHHRAYASRGFPAGAPEVTEVPEELLSNPDWEHDVFDDVAGLGANYAGIADMGFRSLLRVPIRLDGKFAGALVFVSRANAAFRQADALVARRMADRMAVTLARDRVLEASRRADEATARAARLEARVRALTDELDARTGYRRVIGDSAPWRQVLTQATQVAATDTTVLLLGESGTGKEVIARFLHRASPRSGGPFIALNCAALPEQLLEAELFGYERGAFTGATQSKPGQLEQAAGGTLFLDEVGEMSLPAQAKFLRVLQEREFQRLGGTRILRTDARIVAATNRDLQKAIANNQFREDLYYRLNVFAIGLPPLRERRDDILALTQAFLTEFGKAFTTPPAGISREARQMLLAYHWPGNIRELRNVLERAAILCDGGLITEDHLALPAARGGAVRVATAAAVPEPDSPLPSSEPRATTSGPARDLHAMERAMIEQALKDARFNKSKAAKGLGLTRHQLYIRMRRHGLAD